MTAISTLDNIIIGACALATGAFVLQYWVKAPWWRRVEGVWLMSTTSCFFLILVNLLAYRLFNWAGYQIALGILLITATGLMIHQNVILHRVQEHVRREDRHIFSTHREGIDVNDAADGVRVEPADVPTDGVSTTERSDAIGGDRSSHRGEHDRPDGSGHGS